MRVWQHARTPHSSKTLSFVLTGNHGRDGCMHACRLGWFGCRHVVRECSRCNCYCLSPACHHHPIRHASLWPVSALLLVTLFCFGTFSSRFACHCVSAVTELRCILWPCAT